ncbi:MAG: 5'-deoxyadenosine deaminase [Calditrichia bacterium]
MGILLKNGLVVTQNPQRDIFTGDILIEDDRIKKIESHIEKDRHQVVNLKGLVVTPGFIQSHVHICQTLFRNLADDMELLDWLQTRIWPMEMAHNEESLRASARLGLAEMMLSGATCILDMGNGQYQDIVFEEILHSGMRGFSGKVMMDSGDQLYKETTQSVLAETESLIQKWHKKVHPRVQYALAPRFVPSCSPDLWAAVKDLSERYNLIVHTHSSENQKEWNWVKKVTGQGNVNFFVEQGLASPRLCLAHCIWISEEEIEKMAEFGINVLHCPSANLKLGSGIAPIPKLMAKGISIGLGADGAACNNNLDIFMEMRLAALIQKPFRGVVSTTAEKIFDMATVNGARLLGLADEIGSLEEGKKADLTILNLNKVHCIPADNIYSQIIYSARASDVQHVMVDGQWIVFNQKLQNYNYQEIVQDSWEQIQKLFERSKR